jgi:hypothetical protein
MRRVGALLLAVALAAGPACGGDGDAGDDDDDAGSTSPSASASTGTATTGPATPRAADLCGGASLAPDPPPVAQADLTEVSGLAASRTYPGVLWAHNDSGGEAEVFAVGIDGADRGRFALEGADAVDWEDMALGPAPGGGDALYLADIGDNDAEREGVTVYRVAEPDPAGGQARGAALPGVEALPLTYADGPRNAEALLADPVSGDLFVVEKDLTGGRVPTYRIPAGAAGTPVVMEAAGDAELPPGEIVTGGDVSADGSLVALRTYTSVLLWDRAPRESVPEALAAEPCRAATPAERQGEAIAFMPDGRGYTTVGEGEHPPVNTARLG